VVVEVVVILRRLRYLDVEMAVAAVVVVDLLLNQPGQEGPVSLS
jgi:hypothetical protein